MGHGDPGPVPPGGPERPPRRPPGGVIARVQSHDRVRLLLAICLAAHLLALGSGTFLAFTDHSLFAGHPFLAGIAARVRQGEPVHTLDYVIRYGVWAAAGSAVLLAGLLATVRCWLLPGEVLEDRSLAPRQRPTRWLLLGTMAAMLTAAILGHVRLSQSLWDDEVTSVLHTIDGAYRPGESGQLEFLPAPWWDTLWYYRTPNNHVPYSIVSRLSLTIWRKLSPEGLALSETAVRLPAYLAGIASIGATAWLLWRIGFPLAGVFAAWLLALHPWHLRYLSEARGYALLLLLAPLSLGLLVNAVYRGTWRRWIGYGVAQLLLLWTYPPTIFLVAILNVVAAVAIWRFSGGTPGGRQQQMARWAVVSLAGAALFLQLMAPNFVQFADFLDRDLHFPLLSAGVLQQFASYFFAGMPWGGHPDPQYPELLDFSRAHPGVFWSLLGFALAGIGAGAARLLTGGGTRALLVLALTLPAPLICLVSWLRDTYLLERYLIVTLPGFVILLSIGWTGAFRRVRPGRLRSGLTAVTMALFLLGFVQLTDSPRRALRERSLQPIRESVAHTRSLDPCSPDPEEVVTVTFFGHPRYYDPFIHRIESPEQLRSLIEEAETLDRPLFVNLGGLPSARRHQPELMRMVEEGGLFEEVATLPAFLPGKTRRVYRHHGSSRGQGPGSGIARGSRTRSHQLDEP